MSIPVGGVQTAGVQNKQTAQLTHEQKLQLFDTNSNGVLDGTEVALANVNFNTYDKNKDGKFSASELSLIENMFNKAHSDIKNYDKDGSGGFSAKESKRCTNQYQVTIASPFTTPGYVGDHINWTELYAKYDLDGDGELSEAEWLSLNVELDADGDGKIADNEANKLISEQQNNVLKQNGEFKPGFGDKA